MKDNVERFVELLPGALGGGLYLLLLGVAVVLVILWTILPWYILRISDRVKTIEDCLIHLTNKNHAAEMAELRAQTLQLRALVDALRGAEVERK